MSCLVLSVCFPYLPTIGNIEQMWPAQKNILNRFTKKIINTRQKRKLISGFQLLLRTSPIPILWFCKISRKILINTPNCLSHGFLILSIRRLWWIKIIFLFRELAVELSRETSKIARHRDGVPMKLETINGWYSSAWCVSFCRNILQPGARQRENRLVNW